MAYGTGGLDEHEDVDVAALPALLGARDVLWVDVAGLGDAAVLEAVGRQFGIHPLALEDVINVHQRPKAEEYGDQLFVVTRMPVSVQPFDTEQVALFVGRGYVVSFQERPGDCFDPVRERIRRGTPIRGNGADYLLYALLDAAVDAYFPVLEQLGERLEDLEDMLLTSDGAHAVAAVHELKHDLLTLRRAVWPQRDMLNGLLRERVGPITDHTRTFLRDGYDHAVQLMDIVETYREIASGLHDLYLSSQSARLNEVMKVLTIIATIFIPLSFVAGIYGMNFDPEASPWNMPELGWYLGYPFALGLMAAVGLGLFGWFWRKGWLDGRPWRRRQRAGRLGGG